MPVQSQEFLTGPDSAKEAVKCALFVQVISRYGRAKLKALGSSMIPAIWPGDTLLVELRTLSGLGVGDVAVYLRGERLFAHRVVKIGSERERTVITRGDAMAHDDPPLLADEIVGRVQANGAKERGCLRCPPGALPSFLLQP
jgi:signal peptidase I